MKTHKLKVLAIASASVLATMSFSSCEGLWLADPGVSVGTSVSVGTPYYGDIYYNPPYYGTWPGNGYWPGYRPDFAPLPPAKPPVIVVPGGNGQGPTRPINPGVSGIPVSPSQRPGNMGQGNGGNNTRPSGAEANTQMRPGNNGNGSQSRH